MPELKKGPPSLKFLFAHPAHFIACGCGSGLTRWAPGTFGTLFAWITFVFFRPHVNDGELLTLLAGAYLLGIWAIDVTGKGIGDPDHGSIVWDEIVPFWLVLFMVPESWIWQLAAFAFFRLFDIVKWPPADWFDQPSQGC